MYPVSLEYQEKIKENKRLLEAKIQIQHSKGVLNLSDKDLVTGTLIYTEGSQAGEEFTIGSTVASDISFTILNKSEYDDINFMGSMVTCSIGLEVKEGIDAHFIQPSQPSKMKGYERKFEYVPLGRFNIDYDPRQRNTIELKAIDNMINLDKPYSLSKLSYPATLYQIYVDICNVADVNIGTTNFINKDYIVQKRPSGDLSLRDVLGYVAELTGSFARMNRNGALELKWYTPTGLILNPSNRFDFKPSDDLVQIKGIMATVEDTTYLSGSEDYAIDLTENPLLQGGYETVLPNIFNKVKDTVFTPYESSWQGNMAIQAGDIITQIDRDGKVYKTLVTNSTYKYRGASKLAAKGLPEISKGFKGSTNRKIAEIKRKVEEEVGDQLSSLEQAQLNATELIANMLGGYIVEDKPNGIFYIADNPNIDLAMKVWKYGINGFGYSSTGKDGPYSTAVTADGSIVAMLVSANIITANMVQTGILQANNGKSWFDLDKGILRISHGGDVYSQMDINGFGKNYGNGMVSYLNDIYILNVDGSMAGQDDKPEPLVITLPSRFKNRGSSVQVMLALNSFNMSPASVDSGTGALEYVETRYVTNLNEVFRDFSTDTPKIYIEAYNRVNFSSKIYTPNWVDGVFYRKLGFLLIVIGG